MRQDDLIDCLAAAAAEILTGISRYQMAVGSFPCTAHIEPKPMKRGETPRSWRAALHTRSNGGKGKKEDKSTKEMRSWSQEMKSRTSKLRH